MFEQLTSPQMMKFIDKVMALFKGVPHLPPKVVAVLVTITPWLVGLGGIASVLGGLNTLLGSLGIARYSMFGISPLYFIITGIFELAMGALLCVAFGPLKDKQERGWVYLFWSEALSLLMSLVSIIFFGDSIVGPIVGLIIGLYILGELRGEYKGAARKVDLKAVVKEAKQAVK